MNDDPAETKVLTIEELCMHKQWWILNQADMNGVDKVCANTCTGYDDQCKYYRPIKEYHKGGENEERVKTLAPRLYGHT